MHFTQTAFLYMTMLVCQYMYLCSDEGLIYAIGQYW